MMWNAPIKTLQGGLVSGRVGHAVFLSPTGIADLIQSADPPASSVFQQHAASSGGRSIQSVSPRSVASTSRAPAQRRG